MTRRDSKDRLSEGESRVDALKRRLKLQLLDLIDSNGNATPNAAQRVQWHGYLRANLLLDPNDSLEFTSEEDKNRLITEVLDEVVGLGPLDPLLADRTITEIMVNGPHQIYIERNGQLSLADGHFTDEQHLLRVIERMLGKVGRTVNEAEPLCDASLPDGSRINVIIPPLVLNGPVVTIRRKSREWTMAELLAVNVLSEQAAEFLQACVKAKVNMVISGATSTGKTTLVTVLSAFIPTEQRVITIENVPELELAGLPHWIRMVAKAANLEGKGEVPLRELVKNALRMRPDRIILGEARGGEAFDVVQAMHSGHDGFITVLHGNTAQGALERLETLMLLSDVDVAASACRRQIASAVDLVVHVGRFADGSRRVVTIAQVVGNSDQGFQLEELFTFQAKGFSSEGKLDGVCRYTGARPKCLEKFILNNVAIPAWVNNK